MLSLGPIDTAQFLKEYWQKKPLLIRQAFAGFQSPISPDELAGLACEENVESRIVIENDQGKPWQLRRGPFEESAFQSLPPTHWTLLVQGLDYWVPEVSDLLEHFRFIPNWRIDDIMASYAPPQGSVGPHFDYYDVFLLQAQGRRTWKVGPRCNGDEPCLEGTPLRILQEFITEQEWVLEPGDMLYLPPQYAHYGIALEDCITLSIGFRSPSHEEILSSWAEFVCDQMTREIHLDDPDLRLQDNPGEISPQVLDQVTGIIRSYLDDRATLAEWFGRYTTAPKYNGIVMPPDRPLKAAGLKKRLADGGIMRRNEGSRLSFVQLPDALLFFVDGEMHRLKGRAAELAQILCQNNEIYDEELDAYLSDAHCVELLLQLVNQGSLYLEEEE